MNIEELFDNEIYHNYGMLTTEDANCLINYLKTEVTEYVDGLHQRIAELEVQVPSDGGGFERLAMLITAELWAPLQFNPDFRAPEAIRYVEKLTAAYNADRAADKQRIAELEARNKELMCAMREWYEDGFNRGDCGELIVKHGGEA